MIVLECLFFIVPLAFFLPMNNGFFLSKEVVAVIMGSLYILLSTISFEKIFKNILIQWFFIFGGWVIVDSILVAPDRMKIPTGIFYIFLIGFVVIIGSQLSPNEYYRAIDFFLGSSVLVCIYGIFQHFKLDTFIPWTTRFQNRPFSTLGNPDYLAQQLGMIIPLFLIRIVYSKKIFKCSLNVISFLIVLITFFFCRVRGSEIALVGSLIFLIWILSRFPKEKIYWKWKWFIFFEVIILFLGMIVWMGFHANELHNWLGDSFTERLKIYHATWKMILNHFWFGVGAGNFKVEYPFYQWKIYGSFFKNHTVSLTTHAHNEFLQIWAESGVVGLILFLIGLFLYFKKFHNVLKNVSSNSYQQLLLLGIGSGVVGVLIQALSNFPFQVPSTAILTGLFLSAPSVLVFKKNKPMKYSMKARSIFTWKKIFGLIGVIFLFLFGIQKISASIAQRDALGELSLNHFTLADYYSRRLIFLNGCQASSWSIRGDVLDHLKKFQSAEKAYINAAKINPYNIFWVCKRAQTYFQLEKLHRTIQLCNRVIKLVPNYPFPYFLKGEAWFHQGNYKKAIGAFQKVLMIFPNDFQSNLDVGVCEILLGNRPKARQYWQKAHVLRPTNSQVIFYLNSISGHKNIVK
jgi:O-antigen ligase